MNLATTENLRARAKSIFDCAVAAADPAEALKRTLVTHPLPIPAEGGRTFLISIGKAAPEMLRKLRTSCSSVGNGRLRDAEKPAFQSLIIG